MRGRWNAMGGAGPVFRQLERHRSGRQPLVIIFLWAVPPNCLTYTSA